MEPPKMIQGYIDARKTMTQQAFEAAFRCPVLVGIGMVGDVGDGKAGGGTMAIAISDEAQVQASSLRGRVWQLKKDRPGGLAVTVGRGRENDIVIQEFSISTAHAEFKSTSKGVELTDVGSSNGTMVGPKRLMKKRPELLPEVTELTLGRFRFNFFDGMAWVNHIGGLAEGK